MNAPAFTPATHLARINTIVIGERHRRDMGDLAGLAASIRDIGLLHPIVIRPDGYLVAGERRIRAVQMLGWTEIPVTIVDIDEIARGEYAENVDRKAFTLSEAVAIKRDLESREREAARNRQREGGRAGGKASGNLPEASKGRTADKAARATGKKRRTLEKAEQVIAAAEADPAFRDLASLLDEDDVRVDAVHRTMKQRRERAAYEARADKGGTVGDLVAMAEAGQRFKVIYADPPWEFIPYSWKGKQRSAERYYNTSSLDDIKALPIAPLADDDCALFLWGIWSLLPGALDVIKTWGFEYKTVALVWVKPTKNAKAIALDGKGLDWGKGLWTRANTEFCLLATKGSPFKLAQDVHQVIVAPVREHSRKPDEARRRIERLLVGPYLELFARRRVDGWTVWGNETEAEIFLARERARVEFLLDTIDEGVQVSIIRTRNGPSISTCAPSAPSPQLQVECQQPFEQAIKRNYPAIRRDSRARRGCHAH